jgi:hypothetical protein
VSAEQKLAMSKTIAYVDGFIPIPAVDNRTLGSRAQGLNAGMPDPPNDCIAP